MARRDEAFSIVLAAFGLLAINVLLFVLFLFLAGWQSVLFWGSLGIGLVQLIYVIPAIILLKQRQRWGLMKGVIIGAVLTALLNGGCWLLVLAISPP